MAKLTAKLGAWTRTYPAPAATPRLRRQFWICLAVFALAAFLARFGLAYRLQSIARADEVFQSLEPAHRIWSGWGVVTWEWRDGIRSYLFPWFLAALMALSSHLGLQGTGYLPLISATLSLLSLGVVVIGMVLGWRHSGLVGAVLCGVLCGFWPEIVYYSPKTLYEVQAGNLLVIAAGLASLVPEMTEPADGPRRAALCFATGMLLGGVFCLRFQLAPALPLIGIWAARRDLRRGWLPLVVGCAIPLLALGVSDWLTWGSPFQSVWKNLVVNLLDKRATLYGVSSPQWYIGKFIVIWGAALLPVAVFFCAGARYAPLMALTAIVTVLAHSAIGHKEISFIYAAIPAVMIVAGIGTARLVLAIPRLLRPRLAPRSVLAAAAGLWLAVEGLTGISAMRLQWQGVDDTLLPLWIAARKQPDLCGLGLYVRDAPWWWYSGGYTYLNRPVPMYLMHTPEALAEARPGYNYLVLERPLAETMYGDEIVTCTRDYCLTRRKQSCADVPRFEINAVLRNEGV